MREGPGDLRFVVVASSRRRRRRPPPPQTKKNDIGTLGQKIIKNDIKMTLFRGLVFPEIVFFLKKRRINGNTGGTGLKKRSKNLSFL